FEQYGEPYRCFGFVTYATAEQAGVAISEWFHTLEDEHVNEYLSQFGAIEKAEVSGNQTGKGGGGFVYFEEDSSADKTVALKFGTINGHKVEVKTSPSSGGYGSWSYDIAFIRAPNLTWSSPTTVIVPSRL
uniref:RRM domain-containing protein n=1 Tax=Esox lucius TaxID=8010 RepID=A0AAY5KA50_ESOLU